LVHVVLFEPEIPNNTGNIGRSCVALGMSLHLIHPLGFDLSEKACRRAGLDYWPRLKLHEHASVEAYRSKHAQTRRWIFTTRARRPIWEARFEPGDHLVFGNETHGLPPQLHREAQATDRRVSLPMVPGERSLNLATAVCAAGYEAIRQLIVSGAQKLDEAGRLSLP